MLRVACTALAVAGLVGFAAPAAQAAPPSPVSVTVQPGYVGVGTGLPGQPLLGASVSQLGYTTTVCVGFSYQVPFCQSVNTN